MRVVRVLLTLIQTPTSSDKFHMVFIPGTVKLVSSSLAKILRRKAIGRVEAHLESSYMAIQFGN